MESLIPISIRSGFQQAYIVNGIDGSEDLPLYENSYDSDRDPMGG